MIALVAAVFTYLGQYKLWNSEEAMKGLWLSILVFAGTFVLLPLFGFAWNMIRAPRLILEGENFDLLSKNDALSTQEL